MEPTRLPIPIVVLGAHLAADGASLAADTRARCDRAIQEYQELREQGYAPRLLLSPGFNLKVYPGQLYTMAELMRRYMVNHGVPAGVIQLGKPGWGTRHEVRAAFAMMPRLGASVVETGMVFITSKGNVRRTAYIVKTERLGRELPPFKVCIRTVPEGWKPKRVGWELLGWGKAVLLRLATRGRRLLETVDDPTPRR